MDEYCEQKGASYKNYNLTIRKWGIDRAREVAQPKAPPGKKEYFNRYNDFPQREDVYTDDLVERWNMAAYGQ